MGCDIHLCLEKKYKDRWVMIDNFRGCRDYHSGNWAWRESKQRNYSRFAALAGVRGEGPEAVGWPDDASDGAAMLREQYGHDGHSHSWMMLETAALVFEGTGGDPPDWVTKCDLDSYQRFFDLEIGDQDEGYDGPASDYRLLFFFDN